MQAAVNDLSNRGEIHVNTGFNYFSPDGFAKFEGWISSPDGTHSGPKGC
jgi:hypothetical protein